MTEWTQTIDGIFVQPERLNWLWLVGVCLIAIVGGELLRARWRRRLFALAHARQGGPGGEPRRWLVSVFRFVALLLVVLALADPRTGLAAIEVKASKVQIVCLLDRSRSMLAPDAPPNRFERGKRAVQKVVELAGGAAVALVTFAGDARIDVPLTRDYHGLLDRLDEVRPVGNRATGTNVAAGLATAATCFAERFEAPRILVVITDGETHGHQPVLPEDLLPTGTEVLVLGVGDHRRGSPIPLGEEPQAADDDSRFLMHEGNVALSKADPEFLRSLARQLDGRYQSMRDGSSAMAISAVLRRMALAAEEDADRTLQRQAAAKFHWLLYIALALLLLESVISCSKRVGFDIRWLRRAAHCGLPIGCATACVCAASAGWANERPPMHVASRSEARELSQMYNRGVQAHRAGDWQEAEPLFDTVSRRAGGPLSAKAAFNLASTHYAIVNRGGISKREAIARLQAAIDLLRRAIADGDRPDDARANIEIIYRRLLQIQQQPAGADGDGEPSPPDKPSADRDGDRGEGQDSGQPEADRDGDEQSTAPDPGRQPPTGNQPPTANQPPPGSQPPAEDPPRDGGTTSGEGDRGGEGDRTGEGGEGDASGAGQPSAAGPADAPAEPLTDQSAEDQLGRIRQRARDRRADRGSQTAGDRPSVSAAGGLPW